MGTRYDFPVPWGWFEVSLTPAPAQGDTEIWFPPAVTPRLEVHRHDGTSLPWQRGPDGVVRLRLPEEAGPCALRFQVYETPAVP